MQLYQAESISKKFAVNVIRNHIEYSKLTKPNQYDISSRESKIANDQAAGKTELANILHITESPFKEFWFASLSGA